MKGCSITPLEHAQNVAFQYRRLNDSILAGYNVNRSLPLPRRISGLDFVMALRWLQRAMIIALASMAATGSAWACSCYSPLEGGIPQASFISASLISRVNMIGLDTLPASYCDKHRLMNCTPRKAGIFVVEETLKGTSRSLIRIAFDTSLCGGPSPSIGEATWVAVYGDAEVGYFFAGCTWFGGPPAEGDEGPLAQTIAQYRNRLESVRNAAREHPSDVGALMELAKFLAETQDRLEAISIVDKVLAADPLHREANILKAEQLARGPSQEAVLDSLAPYLAAHPDDQDAMHERVLALVQMDRLDEVPANWQDFTGIIGSQYDFSNRKLNGASFRGNYMDFVSFAKSELRHADFSNAHMGGVADFAGADLAGAVMSNVQLGGAKFTNAVLDGADLSGAWMQGSDLRGASLKGANLSNARIAGALYDNATIWPDGFNPVAATKQ
jgi:uncharacterized protein YjbI with pentapeptide repeats